MTWRSAVLGLGLACCAKVQVATIDVESHAPAVRDGALAEAIGIETLGGAFTPLLEVGCSIPCETTRTFSTAADGQSEISLSLFRGTAKLAAENLSLGRFVVVGLPAKSPGETQVAITLRAESSGVLLLARELSGAKLQLRREP